MSLITNFKVNVNSMKEDIRSKNIRIFSMHPWQIFSGKYATRVCFIGMCVVCITAKLVIHTNKIKYSDSIFVILPCMLVVICFTDILIRRFAYRIYFDLDKSEVQFFMFLPLIRKKIITVKIEDIEKITLNIAITFLINGKKVCYNGVHNDELVTFLENLRPVSWKYLGRFFNKYHEWL